VRALYAEVQHEHTAVRRLLHNANRSIGVGTAGEPTPVIPDKLKPIRECRFFQERRKGGRDVTAVHQHDRLSRTSNLIFQPFSPMCPVHMHGPFLGKPID
jgi:hypothetical protein